MFFFFYEKLLKYLGKKIKGFEKLKKLPPLKRFEQKKREIKILTFFWEWQAKLGGGIGGKSTVKYWPPFLRFFKSFWGGDWVFFKVSRWGG